MRKAAKRQRDICLPSAKAGGVIHVPTYEMKTCAEYFERSGDVLSFRACVPLDASLYGGVKRLGIRTEYFKADWLTDFVIVCARGRKAVREVVRSADLTKRAVQEQLELSRRYWSALDVADWKIVIVNGGGGDVL